LSANKSIDFDWGVMPYPDLTTETNKYSVKPTVRGTAGLATAWFITNSAENKGTVDGCVDLMMYLTAPQNNNRLIGDLKGGIPLNPDENTVIADYLTDLNDIYVTDYAAYKQGKRTLWASYNTWVLLGDNFRTAFIKTTQDMTSGSITADKAFETITKQFKNNVIALKLENEYDTSKW